jgi:very-long-chain (3R)-3-hydroxyacyl-CoA dehydratase
MGPKDLYLIVYNLCCCVGWSIIFASAVLSLFTGITSNGLSEALANVYDTGSIPNLLFYTQSAAVLEIFHAAAGLVRSPVFVTAMQVSSRIFALMAVTYSPIAQGKLLSFVRL